MKKFSHPLIFHSFKFALIWLSSTEWKAGPAGCVLECLVVLRTEGNYGDKCTGACRYVGQGITVSESQDVSSIPVFLVFPYRTTLVRVLSHPLLSYPIVALWVLNKIPSPFM
ncbi:hypothetical protein HHX47_DHR8000501 [Lentinula edodes]|nr:hypothetical protein HHX47_DHR8000501 [Lentinula edodes]